MEHKRLLTQTLKLERERENDHGVAQKLQCLANINWDMRLLDKGIQQAKEALEIYERLGDTVAQAGCLVDLARLLNSDKQYDAAEEATFCTISLILEESDGYLVCCSHHVLSKVYWSRGEREAAIYHQETALEIASASSWRDDDLLFLVHFSLAGAFVSEGRLDNTKAHLERAKLYAANNVRHLGYVMQARATFFRTMHMMGGFLSGTLGVEDALRVAGGRLKSEAIDMLKELWPKLVREIKKVGADQQGRVWYEQHSVEEIRSEALRAADIYKELGAAGDTDAANNHQEIVQLIKAFDRITVPGSSGSNCEFLQMVLLPTCINCLFQAQGTK